jgi:hypothetical protein
VQKYVCVPRSSSGNRGRNRRAASQLPSPRTPVPGLWVLLLLIPMLILLRVGDRQFLSQIGELVAISARLTGPLAPEVRPVIFLLLAGIVLLLVAGRLRAGGLRTFLPYALPLIVVLSTFASLQLFPDLNLAEPGWRFARKRTDSLTEAALMSPSFFVGGHGRLCLMTRDYLHGRTLVTNNGKVFKRHYGPMILPDLSCQLVGDEMTLSLEGAERLLPLPGDELPVVDGPIYRFVDVPGDDANRVFELRYREFSFLVPESLARQLAEEGLITPSPGADG